MTEETISRIYVSLGSAETLVRRGRITNHHLTAYCLSNIFAKNYQNWFLCVDFIVCCISVILLDTVYNIQESLAYVRHNLIDWLIE